MATTVAAAILGASSQAQAHLGNLSHVDFDVRGSTVTMRVKYAAHLTPGWPVAEGEAPARAQVSALKAVVREWLDGRVSMLSGAKACRPEVQELIGPDANDDLQVIALWTCPGEKIRALRIAFRPFDGLVDDWQSIASLRMDGRRVSTVFTSSAAGWSVGSPGVDGAPNLAPGEEATAGGAFLRFFRLGAEHIWSGYDHILFLLAVLLAGGGLLRLVAIVTSFTIAHSITLGAAVIGWIQLPPGPVEVAIALSIVFVAAENVVGRGAGRRPLVTFLFGLVHGIGFAGILAESGLPSGAVLLPLLAFNLGVEAGQFVVLAVVLPVIAMAHRVLPEHRLRVGLSVPIALAGLAWATERIFAML